MGVYLVGCYEDDGTLKRLGHFFELDAAIAEALAGGSPRTASTPIGV